MSHGGPDIWFVLMWVFWIFCIIILFCGFSFVYIPRTKRMTDDELDDWYERRKWEKWGDEYKAERRKGNERGIF